MERVFGKILLILNGVTCSCVSIFTCNVFVRVCMPESTKCAVHTTTARRFFVPCPSQIDRVFTDFRCRKADTWYSDSINYWIIDYTRRKLGIWLDFLTKNDDDTKNINWQIWTCEIAMSMMILIALHHSTVWAVCLVSEHQYNCMRCMAHENMIELYLLLIKKMEKLPPQVLLIFIFISLFVMISSDEDS